MGILRCGRSLHSPVRALIAICLLGLGFWAYARIIGGTEYLGSPTARLPAPTLELTNDHEQSFALTALRGKIVLVYFGYTDCPDVCPMTLNDLAVTMQKLGPLQASVRVVFITLDPRHDKPSLLRRYLAAFNPGFIGLTGSPRAIAGTARRWHIIWHRVPGHPAFIDHSSKVTLIGPHGNERLRYGVTQVGNTTAVATDIRRIWHER